MINNICHLSFSREMGSQQEDSISTQSAAYTNPQQPCQERRDRYLSDPKINLQECNESSRAHLPSLHPPMIVPVNAAITKGDLLALLHCYNTR
jgi:hypothetical protein